MSEEKDTPTLGHFARFQAYALNSEDTVRSVRHFEASSPDLVFSAVEAAKLDILVIEVGSVEDYFRLYNFTARTNKAKIDGAQLAGARVIVAWMPGEKWALDGWRWRCMFARNEVAVPMLSAEEIIARKKANAGNGKLIV